MPRLGLVRSAGQSLGGKIAQGSHPRPRARFCRQRRNVCVITPPISKTRKKNRSPSSPAAFETESHRTAFGRLLADDGLASEVCPGRESVQYRLPGPLSDLWIVRGKIGLCQCNPQVRFFGGFIARVAYSTGLGAFGGAQTFLPTALSIFEIINSSSSKQPISIFHLQL